MATTITAGNATNGAAVASDNTGILELKTGTGAGTTALTLNASQNATLAGTLNVGAVTSTGLVTGATGALYPIVSGTAQTAPFTDNTRAEFTGIPSWAKRITVMLQAVGTNGSSILQVQVGSGSFSTSGYTSQAWSSSGSTVVSTGIYITSAMSSGYVLTGMMTLCLVGSNTWVATGMVDLENATSIGFQTAGRTPALSGALDRIRVLAVNGTDTFDTGSIINILYE